MSSDSVSAQCRLLPTGDAVFPAIIEAMDGARQSVRLEMYIFARGELADRIYAALLRCRHRGVRVQVLIDSLGSSSLPASYWEKLIADGGEVRWFNPLSLRRLGIRDHRKVLVCDERVAFIGGFNIAPEYEGDGVTRGWCDLGAIVGEDLAVQLAVAFDEMFARADFRHKRFSRFRKRAPTQPASTPSGQLLLSGPGRGDSPIKSALRRDLARAKDVRIMVAYFLPTHRIRRDLGRAATHAGRVQLLLAGKSDVSLSQLAGRSLFRRFLRVGVEVYEYQPQILHAKLFIVDGAVYVGSANLDQRSLNINYELLVRFERPDITAQARALFDERLQHCQRITREEWRAGRTIWRRLRQRLAYYLLVRIDPLIARIQWRELPD